MRLGAAFDPDADGDGPALTREGGHSHNRIVHSGGDRSGAEVQRTLDESAMAAGVEVLERAFALDLVDRHRRRRGAAGRRRDRSPCSTPAGGVESVGVVTARAVVLATGGYGQVFAVDVEPAGGHRRRRGDRPAGRARRPRRRVRAVPPDRDVDAAPTPRASRRSSARRCAARARSSTTAPAQRVMVGVHPQEDLAPRDVVAAAISRRMAEAPGGIDDHVFLDATHMGERFYTRFPSITAACRAIGIDPARDRIPVAPAAHYACGGVPRPPRRHDGARRAVRRRRGRRAPASTAPTGWRRTASPRASSPAPASAATWPGRCPTASSPTTSPSAGDGRRRRAPRRRSAPPMSRHVGVVRDAESLATAASVLDAVAGKIDAGDGRRRAASWEATNLLTVGVGRRRRRRGAHARAAAATAASDFPEPRDEWLRHLDVRLGDDGELRRRGAA